MIKISYTNRLINEKSPYLLQHAHNPVDWFPWGEEAFQMSKVQNKPIFLSIGYSTCHWCHVMEKESFEDREVANILNENFVCIKVDREERPDVDHIYMTACQLLTGGGGWPLTAFLTPDKKPFYVGTYFPKKDRMGMPGLLTLLSSIIQMWQKNKTELTHTANQISSALLSTTPDNIGATIEESTFHDTFQALKDDFDKSYGGFGYAPKFPSPHQLLFLLRYYYRYQTTEALQMVEKTLQSMYQGGIFDHVGYGFSRYSTDEKWLIPHFEKMLYDNALLAITYMETWQITNNPLYQEISLKTLMYITRELTSPEGGFYAAEDADSEGEEGKFYAWTKLELLETIGIEQGEKFCRRYHVTDRGNFEGRTNVLNQIGSLSDDSEKEIWEDCLAKLFAKRELRIHPHKDDKVLTAWNGLMIVAFAKAYRLWKNHEHLQTAEKAVNFILSKLVEPNGRLLARYRDGESAYRAYADDYAFMIWGLTELYQATYTPHYLKQAIRLQEDFTKLFWDTENGGFMMYGTDSEALITRPKEAYDSAMPSANSVAAHNLIKLYHLTNNPQYMEQAQSIFSCFSGAVTSMPRGYSHLISAALYAYSDSLNIIFVEQSAETATPFISKINQKYMPFTISMLYSHAHQEMNSIMPELLHYTPVNQQPTAYLCKGTQCKAPITDLQIFEEEIKPFYSHV